MGLKNADLCTRCGKMRTRHPSGLCCRCRTVTHAGICKICGAPTKRGGDCCYRCRKHLPKSEDLETAIVVQQKKLTILKLRKDGASYSQIAEAVGMSKSQVHAAYCEMMRLPIDMDPEMVDALVEKDPAED